MIGNSIADVSALSNLTNLTELYLSVNVISDISALAGLTALDELHLSNNFVSDVSALAGLTGLDRLELEFNSIADVSALAGLTNMGFARLNGQRITVPASTVAIPTANPVRDVGGDPVAVSSSDADFTFDPVANEWTFTATGPKTLSWSVPVTVGSAANLTFSGTINHAITAPPMGTATPQDPEVVQAVCVDGDVVSPQINLPTTEGIEYTVEGNVAPGETVTVWATAAEHHVVVVGPGSDWVGDSDGLFATLEITLDTVDCAAPPVIDGDDDSQGSTGSGADNRELPDTGMSGSLSQVGMLGLLMVLTGVALMAARRSNATG